MGQEEYLDDVILRILRVTEDLRAIQRDLNCAAMEAPANPELLEVLNRVPEIESLEVLKSRVGPDASLPLVLSASRDPGIGIWRETARYDPPKAFERWLISVGGAVERAAAHTRLKR